MKKVGVQLNDAHCAPERNGCFIEKARFQVESTFTLCLCYGWHTNVCYVCDNARTMTIVTSLLCSLSDVTYGCEAVHFRPSSFFVLLCGPQGIPTRLPNLNRNTNNYMLIEFGKVPPPLLFQLSRRVGAVMRWCIIHQCLLWYMHRRTRRSPGEGRNNDLSILIIMVVWCWLLCCTRSSTCQWVRER